MLFSCTNKDECMVSKVLIASSSGPGSHQTLTKEDLNSMLCLEDVEICQNSADQARSQEVRGNKDYLESPWLPGPEEVSKVTDLSAPPPPSQQDRPLNTADYKGRLRKTSCTSFGMGMRVMTSFAPLDSIVMHAQSHMSVSAAAVS